MTKDDFNRTPILLCYGLSSPRATGASQRAGGCRRRVTQAAGARMISRPTRL